MPFPRIQAIVPAAGEGRRLAARPGLPKQYQRILGKPMLQWAIERLAAHHAVAGVTVALAPGDREFATLDLRIDCPVDGTEGGATRAQSVLNAIVHAQRRHEAEWVLVHDAARPCLGSGELNRLLDEGLASEHGAILALPVSDTLKRGEADPPCIDATVPRDGLWAAQTPQLFPARALREAIEALLDAGTPPTDEAGAMEAHGYRPRLVRGATTNLKVTWPGDLVLAEALLRRMERLE